MRRFCETEFGDQASVPIGFTGQFDEIEHKLESISPGGLTAMFDSAQLALREMHKAERSPGKRS